MFPLGKLVDGGDFINTVPTASSSSPLLLLKSSAKSLVNTWASVSVFPHLPAPFSFSSRFRDTIENHRRFPYELYEWMVFAKAAVWMQRNLSQLEKNLQLWKLQELSEVPPLLGPVLYTWWRSQTVPGGPVAITVGSILKQFLIDTPWWILQISQLDTTSPRC